MINLKKKEKLKETNTCYLLIVRINLHINYMILRIYAIITIVLFI